MGVAKKNIFAGEGKIVLLAEDEPIVRSVVSINLRRMGLDVLSVSDGVEAVDMFKVNSVDLALLDYRMPHMDGYSAFKKIRAINPDLPVVIISGHDDQSIITRFGSEQPNQILIKPVPGATLREAIARWIPMPGVATGVIPDEPTANRVDKSF